MSTSDKKRKHRKEEESASESCEEEKVVKEKKHKKSKKHKHQKSDTSEEAKHKTSDTSGSSSPSSENGEKREKKKKKKHKKDKEERTEEKAQEEERDDSIDVTELDKNSDELGKNSDELGQWGSSSLFKNDNRQEKFLRLMGGGGSGSGSGGGAHRSFVPGATQFQGKAKPRGIFQQRLSSGGGDEKKKNLYGSLQSAMTVDRAEKLNSNLCHQYEDARKHHFQQGKGTGLGFENQVGPDPASKTFHIDAASSNSKKFDD